MKKVDVEHIAQKVDEFAKERDWDQFHSIKNLTMALNVEASELLEIFQWMKEEDSNKVKEDQKTLRKVEEEVADIFIYLVRIAHKVGIDLEHVSLEKIKKNSQKYPIELSKGSSKKYSDL